MREPNAPMLLELRGSEKRAIQYVWYVMGDLALSGSDAEYNADVYGTRSEDPAEIDAGPVSVDWLKATTPDVFAEEDQPDFRAAVAGYFEQYGVLIDHSTWQPFEGRDGERVTVYRP